jgi:hypothetical protein
MKTIYGYSEEGDKIMGYIKRQKSGTYNAGTRSKVSGQGVQTVKLPVSDKKPSK